MKKIFYLSTILCTIFLTPSPALEASEKDTSSLNNNNGLSSVLFNYHIQENEGVDIYKELSAIGISKDHIHKMSSDWYAVKNLTADQAKALENLQGKAIQNIKKEENSSLGKIYTDKSNQKTKN